MRWTNTLNRIFIFSFSVSSSSLWRKFIRQVWRYDYQPITTNLALWRKVYIRTNCWTLHVYLRHHPTNFLVDSQLVFLERETTAMMLKWWSWTFTFLLDIHWQLVVGGAASLRTFYIDINIFYTYRFSWTYQSQFPCLWQWMDERRTEVEQFTSIQSTI